MDAPVVPVATIGGLEAVLALPRAALFLWVPWSQACRCREKLARRALAASPDLPQTLHRIDLESGDEEVFPKCVQAWIAPIQPPGQDWALAGAGVLLFVQEGRIVCAFGHGKWGPPAEVARRAALAFQDAGPP